MPCKSSPSVQSITGNGFNNFDTGHQNGIDWWDPDFCGLSIVRHRVIDNRQDQEKLRGIGLKTIHLGTQSVSQSMNYHTTTIIQYAWVSSFHQLVFILWGQQEVRRIAQVQSARPVRPVAQGRNVDCGSVPCDVHLTRIHWTCRNDPIKNDEVGGGRGGHADHGEELVAIQ